MSQQIEIHGGALDGARIDVDSARRAVAIVHVTLTPDGLCADLALARDAGVTVEQVKQLLFQLALEES